MSATYILKSESMMVDFPLPVRPHMLLDVCVCVCVSTYVCEYVCEYIYACALVHVCFAYPIFSPGLTEKDTF
jgi:hypothetical protein